MNKSEIKEFIKVAAIAYYDGSPIISDEQFDYLENLVGVTNLGAAPKKPIKHAYRMYSLQKYYKDEGKVPLQDYSKPKFSSPKLDGAAISILYINGTLAQVLTRGDGIEGQDITSKFISNPKKVVPNSIELLGVVQVVGEIVSPSDIPNARNYAAGALNLLSIEEFNSRNIHFIAYGITPSTDFYSSDLNMLEANGFKTVAMQDYCSQFPHDGIVIRVNSNIDYQTLGFTAKHPRGAFAIKERKEGAITTLESVIWQTGKSGKVTPVAIITPVVIGGATITRATLNNVGYIKSLDLSIGDTVEVQRAGEIIPQIVRKIYT
jgi:NAD-dependent DNA ligase